MPKFGHNRYAPNKLYLQSHLDVLNFMITVFVFVFVLGLYTTFVLYVHHTISYEDLRTKFMIALKNQHICSHNLNDYKINLLVANITSFLDIQNQNNLYTPHIYTQKMQNRPICLYNKRRLVTLDLKFVSEITPRSWVFPNF